MPRYAERRTPVSDLKDYDRRIRALETNPYAASGSSGGGGSTVITLSGNYKQITASSLNLANSSVAVDVAGLSATVAVSSGRRIRITFFGTLISTVSGDRASILLREGSTVLQTYRSPELVDTANGYSVTCQAVVAPTAGSHTYKVSIARLSGTGSVHVDASSPSPSFLLVEDIGPAL